MPELDAQRASIAASLSFFSDWNDVGGRRVIGEGVRNLTHLHSLFTVRDSKGENI
jgi:hypothetical protein